MKKINILVIGVGGNVGQGILRALKMSDLDYRVVGACISSESIGLFMCDKAYICPLANDESFISWLIDICEQEKIDVVLSGVEDVLDVIACNLEMLEENTSSKFICSSHEQIKIGKDKLQTCEWLKNNNCNYPAYASSENIEGVKELGEKYGYPLIAKPRSGKGSSGLIIINNEIELMEVVSKEDYIVQQYLGDNNSEYTVGCYSNLNGRFEGMIILKRELKYGTTCMAEVVENEIIYNESLKICNAFKPIGPLNIQLRLHEGIPVCFEINVRFSGTTPMRAHFGFNDVERAIKQAVLGNNIENSFKIHPGKAYRYWDEIYVDQTTQKELEKNKMIDNLVGIKEIL